MRKRCASWLGWGWLLLVGLPGTAGADEYLARRLGALRALVDPGAAAALPPAPGRVRAGRCPSGTWWRMTDYGVRDRIDGAVRDASLRYAIDPDLLRAVIRHESNFQVHAVSHKGAQGLMQLMPATARDLGVDCPFDPRENVLGGARYLRRLRDRLGSWPRALAGYNAGPHAVRRGRIPAETRVYVRRVLETWRPGRVAWMPLD